jgi:regulatory protein
VRSAPRTDRERERALGLLARRGYELELAYDAVRAFEREG